MSPLFLVYLECVPLRWSQRPHFFFFIRPNLNGAKLNIRINKYPKNTIRCHIVEIKKFLISCFYQSGVMISTETPKPE
jgi:hypothetical protein